VAVGSSGAEGVRRRASVSNLRITRSQTPAPTPAPMLDPTCTEREPEVIIAPIIIYTMLHLGLRRNGAAHFMSSRYLGWGGADEQGGLGGGTPPPPMKRGSGVRRRQPPTRSNMYLQLNTPCQHASCCRYISTFVAEDIHTDDEAPSCSMPTSVKCASTKITTKSQGPRHPPRGRPAR